jgi:hypothetical protein
MMKPALFIQAATGSARTALHTTLKETLGSAGWCSEAAKAARTAGRPGPPIGRDAKTAVICLADRSG